MELLHRAARRTRRAYADINNDGRPDLLLATTAALSIYFATKHKARFRKSQLAYKARSTRSNRDGIGAVVRVTAGGETQTQMLRSGSAIYRQRTHPDLRFGPKR